VKAIMMMEVDYHHMNADMMGDHGGLRDQVISLISDAQTADKKEKEYLLSRVSKRACRHRQGLFTPTPTPLPP